MGVAIIIILCAIVLLSVGLIFADGYFTAAIIFSETILLILGIWLAINAGEEKQQPKEQYCTCMETVKYCETCGNIILEE